MSNFNFTPQGWECPKCHRVYSPTTMMCIACPQYTKGETTTNLPIGTPIGGGGYGTTTTSTTKCMIFVADPESGTSPKCINCGKSQIDHTPYTFTI